MMKKYLFAISTLVSFYLNAQVGINTETPQATLQVVGNPTDNSSFDGIIPPRLTGDELAAKTYTISQLGAVVYVSSAPNSKNGQVSYVSDDGYYLFDGNHWQPLGQEFVRLDNSSAFGYATRYRKENSSFYMSTVGNKAVDFSYNSYASVPKGAIGDYSFAIGQGTESVGTASFAGGYSSKSKGGYSFSFGFNNEALGTTSVAMGQNNKANGVGDILLGLVNTSSSSGQGTVILGNSNIVNSVTSFILGKANTANSNAVNSILLGGDLVSNYSNEVIVGAFNEPTAIGLASNDSPIFTIGSGSNPSTKKNSLIFYKNNSFKLAPVANLNTLTSLSIGLHAVDAQGNLNNYNGIVWKKYISVQFSSSAPTTATKGDLYFNNTSNKYFAFDGTSWNPLW